MIKCVICGHQVKSDLSKHINRVHNMSAIEYENKYNTESMSKEYREHLSNNGKNTMNKLLSDKNFIKKLSDSTTKRNLENWKDESYRQFMHDSGVKEWTGDYRKLKSEQVKNQWQDKTIRFKMVESMKNYYKTDEGLQTCLNRSKPKGNKTLYNGILFRSSWEVALAKFFDTNGIEYQYESLKFNYIDNTDKSRIYVPDFYLPKYNLVIEVKPEYLINDEINLLKAKSVPNTYRYMIVSREIINGINSSSTTIENRFLEEISKMVSE